MKVLKVTNSLTYKPFEALAKVKPFKMNQEKKAKEREKFAGKCSTCGAPLVFIPDTNVMVCSNPDCKGRAIKRKGEDGKIKVVGTLPIFRVLNDRSAKYAEKLFG